MHGAPYITARRPAPGVGQQEGATPAGRMLVGPGERVTYSASHILQLPFSMSAFFCVKLTLFFV